MIYIYICTIDGVFAADEAAEVITHKGLCLHFLLPVLTCYGEC